MTGSTQLWAGQKNKVRDIVLTCICLRNLPEEHSLQSRQDTLHTGKWPRKRSRQFLTDASSPKHSRAFPRKRYQAGKRDRATYFSQECIPELSPLWEHLACTDHWDPTAFRDVQQDPAPKSCQPGASQPSCLQVLPASRIQNDSIHLINQKELWLAIQAGSEQHYTHLPKAAGHKSHVDLKLVPAED